MFKTLMLHGQLEPKQIADFIMREHKEARELLYRMFKAGYLQMQVGCWGGVLQHCAGRRSWPRMRPPVSACSPA